MAAYTAEIPFSAAEILDGQYFVFGEAISGSNVVDAIVSSDRDGKDMPSDDPRC